MPSKTPRANKVRSGIDEKFPVKQIAFAQTGPHKKPFITDQTSPSIACSVQPSGPAIAAPARAGAKIEFSWNPWYASHKGPLVTYMAPYEGSVDKVDVNKLSFFKIGESGLAADGKTWAVDEMMANGNVTTAVIPHDIRPGHYVLRHELIALHYATEDSLYHMKADKLLGPQVSQKQAARQICVLTLAAQHYMQCFNIRVEGPGTAEPKGVTFPGAYKPFRQEPGLYFDIWRNVSPYPIPGPALYAPKGPAPQLAPRAPSTQSPTGDAEQDKKYIAAIKAGAVQPNSFTANVNARHLGYGGNPDMTGPPPGSVPLGAVVRGAQWRPTENGLGGVMV
jgi:lytic cellulose monooxygenase (C1-hydroxylating)